MSPVGHLYHFVLWPQVYFNPPPALELPPVTGCGCWLSLDNGRWFTPTNLCHCFKKVDWYLQRIDSLTRRTLLQTADVSFQWWYQFLTDDVIVPWQFPIHAIGFLYTCSSSSSRETFLACSSSQTQEEMDVEVNAETCKRILIALTQTIKGSAN